MKEVPFQVC